VLGSTKYEEVREMSPLRIVDYILLLILAIGWAYIRYTPGFAWSVGGMVLPLIVIVLLFIEDRRK
jgi:fatty acid desaturase